MSRQKRRAKLTLSELQAVQVSDAAIQPSAPSADEAPAPMADAAPEVELTVKDYAPEGVSADVAQLLGMKTRDEAARQKAAELEAQRRAEEEAKVRAAQEAERAAREAEEAKRAEREREAMQAALEQARIKEAYERRAKRKRNTIVGVMVGLLVVAGVGTAVTLQLAQFDPDLTEYDDGTIATAASPHGQTPVVFQAIPEPPPEPEVEEEVAPPPTYRPSGRDNSGRNTSVQGSDLF